MLQFASLRCIHILYTHTHTQTRHALGYPGSRYRLHSLGFRVTQGRVEGLSLVCWGLGIVVWFRAEGVRCVDV